MTQIISNDTRFTSFNLYTTTTTTTTIIFYTNTLKNYVTNEINVILPTLTGKPLAHNKNNRDNFMTLNMTIPKTQNPGAADSLTQQGGGAAADSLTYSLPRRM